MSDDKTTAEERAEWRRLASSVHIPTCDFRWAIDYDGEQILQQRCTTLAGRPFWKDVPKVPYDAQ